LIKEKIGADRGGSKFKSINVTILGVGLIVIGLILFLTKSELYYVLAIVGLIFIIYNWYKNFPVIWNYMRVK
jgi:membrane-bound ClpP family serine protease